MAEEKKIIVDEDWKQQAQKEKEQVAENFEKEKVEKPKMPKGDFPALLSMLSMQAFSALGLIRAKEDAEKEIEPDLDMAKYMIDMLSSLEEKTKGNLDKQEQDMLTGTLHQLRMVFVKMSE